MGRLTTSFNVSTEPRSGVSLETDAGRAKALTLLGDLGVVNEDVVGHALEPDHRRLSWLANRTAGAEGHFPIEARAIDGVVPKEIEGTLYRTAPGQKENHGKKLKSLFDGDAFISGYSFRDGEVVFQGRFIEVPERLKESKLRKMRYSESGTLPPRCWFPGMGIFLLKNQPSVNVIPWDGRLLALSEGGLPTAIDPHTFQFEKRWDFHGTLPSITMNGSAFSAHPKFDPATGEGFAWGVKNINLPWLNHPLMIYKMEKDGRLTTLYTITSLPHYYMIHDMVLTEHYMVFMIPPVQVTLGRTLFSRTTLLDNFRYTDDDQMRIMVLKRDGSTKKPVIIELDANMNFHHGNGYEENGHIVFDSLMYPEGGILDIVREWYKNPLPKSSVTQLTRLVIDPDQGKLVSRTVLGDNKNLPRFNVGMTGKKARYLYTVDTELGDPFGHTLVKHDLDELSETKFAGGNAARVYGEPVFTPRPGGTIEDDGWVMTLGYDGDVDKTFLEITDAASLSFVARVWTPSHFPLGFHGNFTREYSLHR